MLPLVQQARLPLVLLPMLQAVRAEGVADAMPQNMTADVVFELLHSAEQLTIHTAADGGGGNRKRSSLTACSES
jgi:hypothetical protein